MKCIIPLAGPDYFLNNRCKGLLKFKNDFFLKKILLNRPWIKSVEEIIFIMQDLKEAKEFEKKYLKNWFENSKVVYLPSLSRGAAFSSLAGVALAYDKSDPAIIVDLADIYFESDFIPYQKNENLGYAFYFINENSSYSFLKIDNENKIIETKEKKVISNKASAGVYCFPSTSSFIKSISFSIENQSDLTFNDLHYVCPLINYLTKSGIDTIPIKVRNVYDIKNIQ